MTDAWKYHPASDLDLPLIERLRRFPREPDMLAYGIRSIAALVVRSWLRAYHRFEIVGAENLPVDGSFVMIANHSSHLDAICLTASLPLSKLHRAFPAAAADYFFESAPRIWMAAVIVNALPFAREVHIRQSLALCEQLLANPGNILIIFPEGTRTKNGELGRFKSGIGMLASGSKVPVVPCYLDGAFHAWRKGQWFPRPKKLRLRVGAPIQFSHLAPGAESARQVASDLQVAVESLKNH